MEGVSFNYESFGGLSEVRCHVRVVTLGDVVLCGGAHDLAEQDLTRGRRKVTLKEQKIPQLQV